MTWTFWIIPTKGVDQANPKHIQREQGVINMFSAHVVHEDMVEDWTHSGGKASQVVYHTYPEALHLCPGNAERQQHQEKEERNSWNKRRDFKLEQLPCKTYTSRENSYNFTMSCTFYGMFSHYSQNRYARIHVVKCWWERIKCWFTGASYWCWNIILYIPYWYRNTMLYIPYWCWNIMLYVLHWCCVTQHRFHVQFQLHKEVIFIISSVHVQSLCIT